MCKTNLNKISKLATTSQKERQPPRRKKLMQSRGTMAWAYDRRWCIFLELWSTAIRWGVDLSELPEGSLIQHHSAMRTVSNFNINVFWSSFTSWSLLSFYSQKGWRMMQSSHENTETTVLLGAGGILCLKLARPMTGTSLAVDEVPHIKCETYQDNVDNECSELSELTTSGIDNERVSTQ